ncbi:MULTISPECIES: NAD(P)H-dependent oxidoreductase [unclassified Rhizobium]|uniref:FMN-dependent NADH-azoreductase n=1 Tax=unclassified Rhizobium TaxID=2613769 RepID=UPI00084C1276|nr:MULTISPECIES: NAD(P)H-dependent oxidoreductase [unclassified Rhizobium]OEC95128.1 FMN-dependent NADH-azoreductase [Rhizobium sp. YK2]QYA16005.1 NAD(P)H-dependent oxidoreductase [Rhizobium sp. AB2/73]UEQ84548.1 NAD(P)H-dependent oxidoreductase [Rhizobium sp. AB2/73]
MNILHIDNSPRQQSHSRQLSAAIVKRLLEVAPGADIIRRDLGTDPLPQTVALYAAALASPATLAAPPAGPLDLSEQLVREVEAADVVVIGTPMHNLTIPSVLKAWVDQILRVGRTMKSTLAGKVGMLRDRPVLIGVASGGFFTGERANQPDFLTPYLSIALSSIGLKSQQFFPLQGTAFLNWEQAAETRDKTLAALDVTAVKRLTEIQDQPAMVASVGWNHADLALPGHASPSAH